MASGKAVVLHQHGGVDVLKLEAFNWDAPKCGEVLVKLAATSVNPVDVYVRNGTYASKTFPLVSGSTSCLLAHRQHAPARVSTLTPYSADIGRRRGWHGARGGRG